MLISSVRPIKEPISPQYLDGPLFEVKLPFVNILRPTDPLPYGARTIRQGIFSQPTAA